MRLASIALLVAATIAGVTLSQAGKGSGAATKPAPLPLGPVAALGTLAPAPDAGAFGPENVPSPSALTLAAANAIAPGQAVDGISSTPIEQPAYHIHAHLTIFANGVQRQVPYGIGIAPPVELQHTPQGPFAVSGTGFAWLHTHAADGIIHIESPVQRTYTLGNFFDIWQQPLGGDGAGPATGPVTAFLDGRHYLGNPRDIPLLAHAQIQLDVGRPLVAPESIQFPAGL